MLAVISSPRSQPLPMAITAADALQIRGWVPDALKAQVGIAPGKGGEVTNKWWGSKVSAIALQQALEDSLYAVGMKPPSPQPEPRFELQAELAAKHPSVGEARSIGLFGILELVRNRRTKEPMAPFNGTSPEMAALGKFFRQEGLYTFVRWNYFFTNPPLCISEAELREAFAIIDRGLEITDKAVV